MEISLTLFHCCQCIMCTWIFDTQTNCRDSFHSLTLVEEVKRGDIIILLRLRLSTRVLLLPSQTSQLLHVQHLAILWLLLDKTFS
jgi:hypothetical protein